jgi:serine/threonine-protein kinase
MSEMDRLPTPRPGERTQSYHGTGALLPARHAAVDTDPLGEPSLELRTLLRRRMALAAFIGLCCIGVFALILTPFYVNRGSWRYLFVVWFLAVGAATVTIVLRSRLQLSLRALRTIELMMVGAVATVLAVDMWHTLFEQRFGAVFARFGQRPFQMRMRPLSFETTPHDWIYDLHDWMMWALSGWQVLAWVLLLVGYSIFFPNTWKRATIILSVFAAIPIAFHAAICLTDPEIEPLQAGVMMLSTTVVMAFVAAVVIFGSHRNERLRREALAARRLGQYQLKELLGSGGMGEVYRAEHVLLRRPCAIKLIRPERAGDPNNLARFEREVRATATLTNWHTIEIYDYGHAADGTFYYVMEYLPGLTLEQLVNRHGPLPPQRAVHLLRQMCEALREAHAIGLIHRDIKPGNIIVGERGGLPDVAKLLDFGLVRQAGPDQQDGRLTQAGLLLGTPDYMSPEQADGSSDVDARSDLYSLGAVAYFLLSGRPPFVRKTAVQVLAAHLHEHARPLRELRDDVPSDLESVILRCLEKDTEQRFASAAELEEALTRCACAGRWDRARAAAWWRDHKEGKQA